MLKKVLYSVIGVAVLTIVFVLAISSSNPQPSAQTQNNAPIQNVTTSTTSAQIVPSSLSPTSSTSNKATITNNGTSPIQPQYGVRTKTSGCVGNQTLPDPACSPGAVLTIDTSVICVSGYTQTVRDVPDSERQQVFAEYGIDYSLHSGYEVDHIISLELGGSNDISNLYPESYSIQYGARVKDKLENYLHDQVCSGKLPIATAQAEISSNWLKYYLAWQSGTAATPPVTSAPAPSSQTTTTASTDSSSAAYYTSSYGTAKYYYPATCSAWKSLSAKYLVSFDSLQALLAKYPNETLSPQC